MPTLYLARHGETEENVAAILQGHLPGRLTARGLLQAEALADEAAALRPRPQVLLASDLRRTLDTAAVVARRLGLAARPFPLLRERDWGPLTGRPVEEARAFESTPEGVESVEEMGERARRFLIYIKEAYAGRTILAIGHGLFNRTVLAVATGRTIAEIPRMKNGEVRCLTLTESDNKSRSSFWEDFESSVSAD